MDKKISIILSTYNEAAIIKESIDKIFATIENVEVVVVDDNSTKDNLAVIKEILDKSKENFEIINHNHSEHLNVIKEQKSKDTFSNLSSLLKCFEIGKNNGEDLIYFMKMIIYILDPL